MHPSTPSIHRITHPLAQARTHSPPPTTTTTHTHTHTHTQDNPDAQPIYEVPDISQLTADTSTKGTQWGTGGMATKLTAGRIATAAGCTMVRAHAVSSWRAAEMAMLLALQPSPQVTSLSHTPLFLDCQTV
jgi:glutamate 5-kinase